MNARRVLIVIGGLASLHNILRLIARIGGAEQGFFNYLGPFPGHFDRYALAAILGALAVALVAVVIAWNAWTRGGDIPAAQEAPVLVSALWSMLTAALAGLFMVMFFSTIDNDYGWMMFVLTPYLTGLHAALALSCRKRLTVRDALVASVVSSILLGGLLIAVAVEGLICILMAVPLALPIAMCGGLTAYALARLRPIKTPVAFILIVGVTPFGTSMEQALLPPASTFVVTTSIDIAAPPRRVWETVPQPATLAPPTELLLQAGVGYPQASHIDGTGPTAVRYCDFSTGQLVEPVLVWDAPRELKFRVAKSPIPMQEWTPYARLHPPHLDGFLVTRQGQFLLTPLPSGGTRLTARTWYQHHLWPEPYWQWWSDGIIHSIHQMVLRNVRARALAKGLGSAPDHTSQQ